MTTPKIKKITNHPQMIAAVILPKIDKYSVFLKLNLDKDIIIMLRDKSPI